MSHIIQLALEKKDATMWSPKDALENALEQYENGDYNKVIIIRVNDKDGAYDVGFTQAAMKCSEMISACEIIKQKAIENMGLLNEL
jgi:hypothetical protein